MAFLLQSGNRKVVIAVGLGAALGSVVTWWVVKHSLQRVIGEMRLNIEVLRREVDGVRSLLLEEQRRRDAKGAVNSYPVVAATSDDEDEFVDALDVNSDCSPYTDELMRDVGNGIESSINTTQFYDSIDRLLDGRDVEKKKAFEMLKEKEHKLSHDANFLWRFAKATYFISQIPAFRDERQKKELIYLSKNYACRALELDETNSNVHKWCAITIGSSGDYEGAALRIHNGFKFKEHIERAIQLNPKDPSSYYLLGRWCYGVSMLTWMERKLAATFVASPPTSTVDDALQHFLKANTLSTKKWKDNLLHIAKCYVQKADYCRAVEWLDRADKVTVLGQDDQEAQKEVTQLLSKYASYRKNNTYS